MQDSNTPRLLDYKLESERQLFISYYHSYLKCYHEISWLLNEAKFLIKNNLFSSYNIRAINDSLFNYAESSIGFLFWKDGEKAEYHFSHQLLRAWRNNYHHEERLDFILYDFTCSVDGVNYEFKSDFFIIPNSLNCKRLNSIIEKKFTKGGIATDANLLGLVEHHHKFMTSQFVLKEGEMKSRFPTSYLIQSEVRKRLLGGGKYSTLLSADDFFEAK